MRKGTIKCALDDAGIKTEEQLQKWLRKRRKDELYTLYMQATDYEGEDYRDITRNTLKYIFEIEFEELQNNRKNDILV